MIKTILVPTDFSKSADNALDYAAAIAKKHNAKIILFHSFHLTYPLPDYPAHVMDENTAAVIETNTTERLKSLCSKIADSKEVKCEYLMKQGLAVDMILETAKKIRPDFIIMGTKGASGVTEVLLGSNAAKVIEYAQYPVIAVPEGAVFKDISNITYATNYYASDLSAIKKLVEIARPFNARINILHIADGEIIPEGENELLKKFVSKVESKADYNHISFQLIYGNKIEKELEKYINKQAADLLAVSTKKRNLLEKLFGASSISKKLSYHTRVPLLTFHHKQESVVFI